MPCVQVQICSLRSWLDGQCIVEILVSNSTSWGYMSNPYLMVGLRCNRSTGSHQGCMDVGSEVWCANLYTQAWASRQVKNIGKARAVWVLLSYIGRQGFRQMFKVYVRCLRKHLRGWSIIVFQFEKNRKLSTYSVRLNYSECTDFKMNTTLSDHVSVTLHCYTQPWAHDRSEILAQGGQCQSSWDGCYLILDFRA